MGKLVMASLSFSCLCNMQARIKSGHVDSAKIARMSVPRNTALVPSGISLTTQGRSVKIARMALEAALAE